MATLYWGGGTGTWDATTTTNWYSDLARTTLAGIAPTSADDVIFDSSSSPSAYTVTITTGAVCRNWTLSPPLTGNVTISGTGQLRIYGGVTWSSTGITRSYTGEMYFDASSDTHTVNYGGITLSNNIYFGDGQQSNATWNLGSSLSITGSLVYLYIRSGTFSTQNFNITTGGRIYSNISTYTRTIDFGTSTVTISSAGNLLFELSSTNLTFNASSSIIKFGSGGSGMSFRLTGGLNYGTIQVDANQDTNITTTRVGYIGTGAVNINDLQLTFSTRLRT
jgi:hypothetical protein